MMPISDYVRRLREKISHDSLLMPGVAAVVFDEQGRVLLQRAVNDGCWYLPGGALDPGEEPADGIVREVYEETGIHVTPERVIMVNAEPPVEYPNGDQMDYVCISFLCRPVPGSAGPHVNDDESLEVRFVDVAALPPLTESDQRRISVALKNEPSAAFYRSAEQA